MKTSLYKQYENAHPVGAYTMCNAFALVILDINERDEIAVTAFTNPSGAAGYNNIRRSRIHYSQSGRAYIRKGGIRFYFDEISRV